MRAFTEVIHSRDEVGERPLMPADELPSVSPAATRWASAALMPADELPSVSPAATRWASAALMPADELPSV
ncbi:hypothetical protein ABZV64_06115, partial [Streptomyces sp. NPDC004959]|uniref:hypothetical protein n=1 Tax=Streptomyces sp. NPDC004959 TaxID=3154673 RepID=UPI0033A7DDCC